MDGQNAIALSGVTKAYRDFTLDRVTFDVPEGTICGLVGENGAGKTTLIRLIMGAIRATSGTPKRKSALFWTTPISRKS